MEKVTAHIIAYNEAKKIRAAVESMRWARFMVVCEALFFQAGHIGRTSRVCHRVWKLRRHVLPVCKGVGVARKKSMDPSAMKPSR